MSGRSLGTEFVEKAASFYCGSNDQGTPCYETLQINNGSRVAGVCAEDGCPASCSAELQQLVSDVGCCASSIGHQTRQPRKNIPACVAVGRVVE